MDDDYVSVDDVRAGSPEIMLESSPDRECEGSTADSSQSPTVDTCKVSTRSVFSPVSTLLHRERRKPEASESPNSDENAGFDVDLGVVVVVALGILATFAYLRSASK
jgi:hypothetical protein